MMKSELLLLVVMAASLANSKKNTGASSNVRESEFGFHEGEDDGLVRGSQKSKRN